MSKINELLRIYNEDTNNTTGQFLIKLSETVKDLANMDQLKDFIVEKQVIKGSVKFVNYPDNIINRIFMVLDIIAKKLNIKYNKDTVHDDCVHSLRKIINSNYIKSLMEPTLEKIINKFYPDKIEEIEDILKDLESEDHKVYEEYRHVLTSYIVQDIKKVNNKINNKKLTSKDKKDSNSLESKLFSRMKSYYMNQEFLHSREFYVYAWFMDITGMKNHFRQFIMKNLGKELFYEIYGGKQEDTYGYS
jgi:hypothetical protein